MSEQKSPAKGNREKWYQEEIDKLTQERDLWRDRAISAEGETMEGPWLQAEAILAGVAPDEIRRLMAAKIVNVIHSAALAERKACAALAGKTSEAIEEAIMARNDRDRLDLKVASC